jgi:hypothetical protein
MEDFEILVHDHNYMYPKIKRVLRFFGLMKDYTIYERSGEKPYYELGLVVKTKNFTEQMILTEGDVSIGIAKLAFGSGIPVKTIKRKFKGKIYRCSIPC